MVTLRDIARECGFDISTVSRSLTGSPGIRSETREKVLAVAERLNYRPNRLARGLATGRSHTLGLIVSDIRNPFFAEVARRAEDAAYAAGCDLVLCNSDLHATKQVRYVRSLVEKRVAGILMNSVAGLSRSHQEDLTHSGVPIVLLNRPPSGCHFSTVTADNFQGGVLAGSYLIRMGHRLIAHLTGPSQHGNLTDRAKGFVKGVQSARQKVTPLVFHGPHNYQGGYEMTKKVLAKHRRVTAIFAANDAMAFGVIRAIYEAGLSVPEDFSVIGFDNVELAANIRPPLTTIHQPKYEMGQAAVEILLKLAERKTGRVPEQRVLGVEFIERQSVRPLRGANRRAAEGSQIT